MGSSIKGDSGLKAKILVVDDEPDTLLLVTRFLESAGHQVITARDGEQALQEIYKERPQIVLLDVLLPQKDGYQICREVKADDKVRETTIIMLTVKAFEKDRAQGFQAGADHYVTKPFSGEALLRLIENILSE